MATRPAPRFAPLLLVTLALLAFGNATRGSFHFDDFSLQERADLGSLFRLQTTRPLTFLTFQVNRTLAGTDPLPWHVVNLALHLACTVLLYRCADKVLAKEPGGSWAAFLAAGLFAIHPIQTEAVAYIFARSTLLMTLFCLLSWRAWLAARPWAAVGLFALALLAKEECVFFPLFLLWLRRDRAGTWKPIASMLALSLLAGLRVIAATRVFQGSGAGFGAGIEPLAYAGSQGMVISRYLSQLAWPAGFTVDPDLQIPAWAGLAGWLALFAALYLIRRRPEAPYFTGGIVLLLASSSIFPAADLAADRRMYLPLISFSVAAGIALRRLPAWLLAFLAVPLICISVVRTEVWRTELSLWSDAARKAPGKVRPVLHLARELPAEQALPLLDVAEKNHPNDPDLPAEKGRIYLHSNRPDLAVQAFGQAAALRPERAQSWNNLGVALQLLGQAGAAEHNFQRALRLNSCLPDARRNLHLPPCP